MRHGITGLDHLIIGVRDLEGARAQWGRLGFNSTPRGRHIGWATGNYCIMFEKDYLELLGLVDPNGYSNGLDRLLAGGEGLMGMALACADPDLTLAAWLESGLASTGKKALLRLLESETPAVELRFTNVMMEPTDRLGLNVFACHHLTPEPMRRPAWLRHPNGALRIGAATIIADDVEAVAGLGSRLLGNAALSWTDRVCAIQTGTAPILIATPEDAAMLHPGFASLPETAPEPILAAMEITVADPEATARFLEIQGVPHSHELGGAVLVEPEAATGVALAFTPEA